MPHVKYVTFYHFSFESQIGIIGCINFLSNIINLHKKESDVDSLSTLHQHDCIYLFTHEAL